MYWNEGMPRRIDRTGRLCLPVEIRNMCGFKENDRLEIFADNGIVYLRKYIAKNKSLLNLLEKMLIEMANSTGLIRG